MTKFVLIGSSESFDSIASLFLILALGFSDLLRGSPLAPFASKRPLAGDCVISILVLFLLWGYRDRFPAMFQP